MPSSATADQSAQGHVTHGPDARACPHRLLNFSHHNDPPQTMGGTIASKPGTSTPSTRRRPCNTPRGTPSTTSRTINAQGRAGPIAGESTAAHRTTNGRRAPSAP